MARSSVSPHRTLLVLCMGLIATGLGTLYFDNILHLVQIDIEKIKHNEEDTSRKLNAIECLLEDIQKTQLEYGQQSHKDPPLPKSRKADFKSTCNNIIQKYVTEIMDEYNIDEVGKVDYALESAGGRIVGTEAEQYDDCSKTTCLFGWTLCDGPNGPRALIQTSGSPGECWAFKGSSASVVIQLSGYVFINGVTLEHIRKTVSPSGNIDSAPREFSLMGLIYESDGGGQLLGNFVYDLDEIPIQHFQIEETSKSYLYVRLKVHSNYGNPLFTCVYSIHPANVMFPPNYAKGQCHFVIQENEGGILS